MNIRVKNFNLIIKKIGEGPYFVLLIYLIKTNIFEYIYYHLKYLKQKSNINLIELNEFLRTRKQDISLNQS